MCNLQQPPQSDSRLIALRDEQNHYEVIHKMSHSMALNLKMTPLEIEPISPTHLHNIS